MRNINCMLLIESMQLSEISVSQQGKIWLAVGGQA
jgi:hypothetical protein